MSSGNWRDRSGEYHKAYKRAWRSKLKKEKLRIANEAKANPCADCGGVFPPECMDFDHLSGEKKKADVCYLLWSSSSVKLLVDEMKKCEVVCANCHRIRTKNRRVRAGVALEDDSSKTLAL